MHVCVTTFDCEVNEGRFVTLRFVGIIRDWESLVLRRWLPNCKGLTSGELCGAGGILSSMCICGVEMQARLLRV